MKVGTLGRARLGRRRRDLGGIMPQHIWQSGDDRSMDISTSTTIHKLNSNTRCMLLYLIPIYVFAFTYFPVYITRGRTCDDNRSMMERRCNTTYENVGHKNANIRRRKNPKKKQMGPIRKLENCQVIFTNSTIEYLETRQ